MELRNRMGFIPLVRATDDVHQPCKKTKKKMKMKKKRKKKRVLTPKCGPHVRPERGGNDFQDPFVRLARARKFRGGTEYLCGGLVGQAGVAPLVPLFNRVAIVTI